MLFFFVQAEDGIRALVRSRGLGDVYKRQDYPDEIWVGLSSQSPIGNGTSVTFEECSLTQSSVSDFRMGN